MSSITSKIYHFTVFMSRLFLDVYLFELFFEESCALVGI